MKTLFQTILLIQFLFTIPFTSYSQLEYDSSITMNRKNIVRINPTPTGIVGLESIVMGYERVIKPHQSISVNIGRLKFRQFVDLGLEKYGISSSRKSGGLSIAIDYRRYLKKRNRAYAPDGLYWGPFFTYYRYIHENGLSYQDPVSLSTSSAALRVEMGVYHIGVELGYQFIIAKRLAIDLILIGPSWGKYRIDFNVSGNLDIDESNELYQEYYDELTERIPGLAQLVKDRNISKSGHISMNTIGMRYVIQIGFLF